MACRTKVSSSLILLCVLCVVRDKLGACGCTSAAEGRAWPTWRTLELFPPSYSTGTVPQLVQSDKAWSSDSSRKVNSCSVGNAAFTNRLHKSPPSEAVLSCRVQCILVGWWSSDISGFWTLWDNIYEYLRVVLTIIMAMLAQSVWYLTGFDPR
jgi:hypothetical protein